MFSLPIVVVVMVLKTTKRSHYVRVEREYASVLYVKNQAIDIILELRLLGQSRLRERTIWCNTRANLV